MSDIRNADIALALLDPHGRNYRRHPESQVTRLQASLQKFGQPRSIVVQAQGERYRIVAGHGVTLAAQALGWASLRCDVLPEEWPEERVAAYLVADNELSRLAEDDDAALLSILDEARQYDDELLAAMGYDEAEFQALLAEVGPDDPAEDPGPQTDRAEELRQQWGVEPGQLWRLGEHRLICGDCTDPAVVERVMGGERAQLVFTDPPYGVAIGAKNRLLNSVQKAGRNLADIKDDSLSPDELKQMLLPAFSNIRQVVMDDDCTVFVTAPLNGELGMMMMMMMMEAGLPVRHVLIWKKNQPTFSLGHLDYDYQHEPILLTWGKRHKRPMKGDHRTSVWEIDRPRASAEHPTMKPVELVANALLNNSESGDTAFDAYLGSGTTLIACEQLGRRCRAVEIAPGYVAVALQRWADMTGQTPELLP